MSDAVNRDCTTCVSYLSGGMCRINLESECAEGGGYEVWQREDSRLDERGREAYGILWTCRNKLTRQQVRTIKGQIFAGDAEGALKGLEKLMGGKLYETADNR